MALPPEYRRIGKRSKLSPYGTAPGMVYNRYHRGHQAVSAPTGHLGNPVGPADYLMIHPESYAPHPGHASFPDPQYESYEPSPSHFPTPMLRTPQPLIPAPDEITYQDAPMTDELTLRAMEEIHPIDNAPDLLPFDHDIMANGVMIAPNFGPLQKAESIHMPASACEASTLERGWNDAPAPGAVDGLEPYRADVPDSLEAAIELNPLGFSQADPMALEQLVDDAFAADELPPSIELPHPDMEDDPLLFDPWMMPEMGPVSFGPMGPMM